MFEDYRFLVKTSLKRWLKLQIIVSEQFKSLTRLWPTKPKKTLNFKYFFIKLPCQVGPMLSLSLLLPFFSTFSKLFKVQKLLQVRKRMSCKSEFLKYLYLREYLLIYCFYEPIKYLSHDFTKSFDNFLRDRMSSMCLFVK